MNQEGHKRSGKFNGHLHPRGQSTLMSMDQCNHGTMGDAIAMETVKQKEDPTDFASIHSFQREVDEKFSHWVDSHGFTNHILMLGLGHIAQCLFKWNNLHGHSQKGGRG